MYKLDGTYTKYYKMGNKKLEIFDLIKGCTLIYNTHVNSKDFMRIRNPLDQMLQEKDMDRRLCRLSFQNRTKSDIGVYEQDKR